MASNNLSSDSFFDKYPLEVAELAQQARVLIRLVMPEVVEQFDPSANLIAYGTDRSYRGLICGVTIHKKHINLMFAQGTKLFDPEGLLSGTGKKARHVRIESENELNLVGVHSLLEQAAVLGGLGC